MYDVISFFALLLFFSSFCSAILHCCVPALFCNFEFSFISEIDRSFIIFTSRCLRDVLVEKYEWKSKDAKMFSSFIEPMLDYVPDRRATAAQCLTHEFLASS